MSPTPLPQIMLTRVVTSTLPTITIIIITARLFVAAVQHVRDGTVALGQSWRSQ